VVPLSVAQQTRPKGEPWPIDKKWKDEIQRLMPLPREGYPDGITRAELARLCKVTSASITILFRPSTKSTRLKARIHQIFGLAPPTSTPATKRDSHLRRIERALARMNDDDRDLLVANAERLATKT
jgi:hypothetical protein